MNSEAAERTLRQVVLPYRLRASPSHVEDELQHRVCTEFLRTKYGIEQIARMSASLVVTR
jgi:hypothetical protein